MKDSYSIPALSHFALFFIPAIPSKDIFMIECLLFILPFLLKEKRGGKRRMEEPFLPKETGNVKLYAFWISSHAHRLASRDASNSLWAHSWLTHLLDPS